jgi:hypothetical protein
MAASLVLQKLMALHLEKRSNPGEKLLRGLAVVLVFAAFILLMVAGYRWLSLRFDPIEAPALAALVALVISLAVWAIASSLKPPPANPAQDVEEKVLQTAKDLFSDVETDLGKSVKDHPRAAVSVAALAGFLLARKLL